MSKCKKCGKELDDGKKYCRGCKQKQAETLKQVGKTVLGAAVVGVIGLKNPKLLKKIIK